MAGCRARDGRRPAGRVPEGTTHRFEPFDEHASLRAHPAHVVKGVAQAAFAQPDDATESGERHRRRDVRAQIRLGPLDGRLARDPGARLVSPGKRSLAHDGLTYVAVETLETEQCTRTDWKN